MLLWLNSLAQWQLYSKTTHKWSQMAQQSAWVLPEGKGCAFLPLLQLFLLSGSMDCCGGTLDPQMPLELPVSLSSTGSFPAVGTSPSDYEDLLLSLFLLGFNESIVESEELFFRPAYKMCAWIYVFMHLRESS